MAPAYYVKVRVEEDLLVRLAVGHVLDIQDKVDDLMEVLVEVPFPVGKDFVVQVKVEQDFEKVAVVP